MMLFRPKKINNLYGYRTSSSMKNQEAWDVAQRCSAKLSIVFGFLGLAVETLLLFLFPELPLERYILYFIVPYALVTPLFIIVVTELAIRNTAKRSTHGGSSAVKAAIAMTAVLGLSFASLAAGTDAALIGIWSGKLAAGFQDLDVVFHIDGDHCSLDVPAQGAAGVKGVMKSAKSEALKLGDVLDMQLREQLSAAGMSGKGLENELAAAKEKLIYDDGIRRYMEYDPVVAIKATHCPVLAVNGEKDVQVRADRHLPVLRANLAPKDRMTIKSYPKLNHLFQHCKTGAPTEYGQIDETMALEVLEDIVRFVGKFGGEKAKM